LQKYLDFIENAINAKSNYQIINAFPITITINANTEERKPQDLLALGIVKTPNWGMQKLGQGSPWQGRFFFFLI
jgi:hypothetical protein